MTYFEWMDLLRALLPNLTGLLIISALLGSAILAVHTSPGEPAADRHFVLLVSLGGVGALCILGIAIRLLLGTRWTGDLVTTNQVLTTLGGAWALGLLLLCARLALGWISVRWLRSDPGSTASTDPEPPIVRECARHVGLRRVPVVCFATRCRSPMATGILSPTVILPASMRSADEQELRFVLTHEFAHVRRRDCLAELLTQFVGALLWWNPLYWMLAKKLRELREIVCDRFVAAECACPEHYAELLVRFAARSMLPIGSGFATVRMADRSSLHARVEHILLGARISRPHIPRIFPTSMTNLETLGFVLTAVFVMVAFDATLLATLEELLAS